ncbi:major facilitator superfamily-domain-containing protein [Syncephalis fuscata]|nr:major facilitator superfamily-domain-containing protein [Syncephalis fuscata]
MAPTQLVEQVVWDNERDKTVTHEKLFTLKTNDYFNSRTTLIAYPPSPISTRSESISASTIIHCEKNEETYEISRMSLYQKMTIMIGLALIIFLASLDQTIITTALPQISSDFNALDQVSWIGAAYLLTSTATRPLYGRFSDIFGRKPVFLAATVVFLAGSFGCGIAPNIVTLIIMRAIAGIGGGGFLTMTMIIISDIVPPRQRGQYAGIIGAIFSFSSVIGPLLGGFFTDHLTWRWAFYINLPIGAITIVTVAFTLKLKGPSGSTLEKLKRIDYLGTFLIMAFCVALVLAINWGGTMYAWNSIIIIVLFSTAALLLLLFLLVEYRVANIPIIPLSIFRSTSVSAICIGCFFMGWGFFCPIYYLPVFFQTVREYSATKSGMVLLPFVVSVSLMAIVSSTIAARIGKWCYRLFLCLGMLLAALGFTFITLFKVESNPALEICAMIILGVGFGCVMQTIALAAQASVTAENSAIVTALTGFFQAIGGVVGLAVGGSIFNNKLTLSLAKAGLDKLLPSGSLQSTNLIHNLTTPLKKQILEIHANSLCAQYYVLIPIVILAVIAFAMVKPLPLDTKELPAHSSNQKEITEVA